MATAVMRPNASLQNQWTVVNAATAHEALDEVVTQPDPGSEADGYVASSSNNSTADIDILGPSDVQEGTDLTAWIEARNAAGGDEDILLEIRDSIGTVLASTTVKPSNTGYGWHSVTLTGQTWSQADVDGLRIAATAKKVGGGAQTQLRVRAMYGDLTYTATSNTQTLSGTLFTKAPSFPAGGLTTWTTTVKLALTDVIDPGVDTGHAIVARARKANVGDAGDLEVSLREGSTEIDVLTVALTDSFVTTRHEITTASIGDYSNLQLWIRASTTSTVEPQVSQAHIEVPHKAATDVTLVGSLFVRAASFGAGTVASTITVAGTLFARAPTFGVGTVTVGAVTLAGTTFVRAASFPQGTVTAGAETLSGTLFAKAPAFGQGAIVSTIALGGTTFTRAPTFGQGTVAATVALAGTTFQRAPTFPVGAVTATVTLAGVTFTRAPTFGQGSLSTDNITLPGTLFARAPTFPTGAVTVAVTLSGTTFVATATFAVGDIVVALTLAGTLFSLAPTFAAGTVTEGGVVLSGRTFRMGNVASSKKPLYLFD